MKRVSDSIYHHLRKQLHAAKAEQHRATRGAAEILLVASESAARFYELTGECAENQCFNTKEGIRTQLKAMGKADDNRGLSSTDMPKKMAVVWKQIGATTQRTEAL